MVVLFTVDLYRTHKIYRPKRVDVNNEVFQNNILINTSDAVKTLDNQVLITENGNLKRF